MNILFLGETKLVMQKHFMNQTRISNEWLSLGHAGVLVESKLLFRCSTKEDIRTYWWNKSKKYREGFGKYGVIIKGVLGIILS